jgi:hypothetical protein
LLIPLLLISDARAARCIPLAIGKQGCAAAFGCRANPHLDDRAVGSAPARFECAVLAAGEDAVRDFASRFHAARGAAGYLYHSGHGMAVARGNILGLVSFGSRHRRDLVVGEMKRAETVPLRAATAPHAVHGSARDRSPIDRAAEVMPVAEPPETPSAFATEAGASLRQRQG